MKKLFMSLSFIFILSVQMFAQHLSEFKPFKVDVSAGYAIPGGTGSKGGVLFVVEPKYAVISSLAVGLRMEAAIVARFGGYDQDGNPQDVSVKASGSYLATADYYYTNNHSFRPFSGAGAGIFTIGSIETNSNSGEVSAGSKFGGMIRSGVELSHFRFAVEYNIVPKTTFTGYDSEGNLTTGLTSNNSYVGIKLGVCFGGGKR